MTALRSLLDSGILGIAHAIDMKESNDLASHEWSAFRVGLEISVRAPDCSRQTRVSKLWITMQFMVTYSGLRLAKP